MAIYRKENARYNSFQEFMAFSKQPCMLADILSVGPHLLPEWLDDTEVSLRACCVPSAIPGCTHVTSKGEVKDIGPIVQ